MDNVIVRNARMYMDGEKIFELPDDAKECFAFKGKTKDGKEKLFVVEDQYFETTDSYFVHLNGDLYKKIEKSSLIPCFSFQIFNKKENKSFTKVIPQGIVVNKLCAYQNGKCLGPVTRD